MAKPAKIRARSTAKPAKVAKAAKPATPVAPKPAKSTSPGRAKAPTRAPAPRPAPMAATVDESGLAWVDAGGGYAITLDDGKLAARNDKGKRVASVPKEIRDGDIVDQLDALCDWLADHERECNAEVERWMLRSLPVPSAVLRAVWDDPAWRAPLANAVVVAADDPARGGLFRGVDPARGVGVVDLDGETAWLDTDRVAIPHPILIPELDSWRELITQLGVVQGISQLHRETHVKPADFTGVVDQFEDGKFAMLMHALNKARSLGYKVRGGFATCKAWDAGAVSEARYWIGAESPDAETATGQLSWVDDRERGLKPAEIGPVAFSEGMRMASAIYAARVIEKPDGAA